MGTLQEIKKIATAREKAYRLTKTLNGKRAKAISILLKLADFYKNAPEKVQMKTIRSFENELMAIIPDEKSRYKNMRNNILNIIIQSKSITDEKPL
jgi:hypothetical protein